MSNITTWQPIETAKKDGSIVFLYSSNARRIQIGKGYWSNICNCWMIGDYKQKENPPTHWMPLPELPK